MPQSTSERVSLNARVDVALRELARQTAEARGMALNDLIVAAVTAYCQEAQPALVQVALAGRLEDQELRVVGSEDMEEVLGLCALIAADMHLVREVLHAVYPRQEEEARPAVRSWMKRLGIGGRKEGKGTSC